MSEGFLLFYSIIAMDSTAKVNAWYQRNSKSDWSKWETS
jgi:hypothetical protein